MKIKIYDANNNVIHINYYTEDVNATTYDNVYFTYSFTKNTSFDPNPCNISLFGLDNASRDFIKEIGSKYYSDSLKTKVTLSWEIPKKAGEEGKYVFKTTYPKLVGFEETVKSTTDITEDVEFTYQEYGWGKVELFDDLDTLIYAGDIINFKEDNESLNIECGTSYYYLSMPYSQRIFEKTAEESFVFNRALGYTRMGEPSETSMVWSPENYLKVALSILEDIEETDIFGETMPFTEITDDYFNRGTFDNDYFNNMLTKIIKSGKDLSITDVRPVEDKSIKKEKKKADGTTVKVNGYFFLRGTIQQVLEKLMTKSLMLCFSDNDIFKIYPYYYTANYEKDAITLQYQSDHRDKDYPFDYYPISDFSVDNEGRAVFTTMIDKLGEISLGDAVKIVEKRTEYETNEYEVYIDTVDVSGDSESSLAIWSGRIKDFQWRQE